VVYWKKTTTSIFSVNRRKTAMNKQTTMLFSRRDLIRILIPLALQGILSVAIGMVDSMMVSSAGEAAISGVSLVDTFNLLLVYMFSALSTGGAVVISQALQRLWRAIDRQPQFLGTRS
jgi:Na+-driven multidrug efflux pump